MIRFILPARAAWSQCWSAEDAPRALDIWRTLPGGEAAAIIGRLNGTISQVILQTEIGGERLLEELEDDPLPRIC